MPVRSLVYYFIGFGTQWLTGSALYWFYRTLTDLPKNFSISTEKKIFVGLFTELMPTKNPVSYETRFFKNHYPPHNPPTRS